MGKYLIVGASRGIGNAIFKTFHNSEECHTISRSPIIDSENHYELDVLSDELPALDSLDGLVYCPGSINLKPINSLKEKDFQSDFEINVLGAVKVIRKYASLLRKSENGSIVLFSTVAVAQGMPFHASVSAAKAAVEGLMRSLSAEFAPKIRVNCIAPSITNTSLASGILRNESSIQNAKERHPLKQIIEPDEIAAMATFLLSDKSKNITGQVIGIDGGLSKVKL